MNFRYDKLLHSSNHVTNYYENRSSVLKKLEAFRSLYNNDSLKRSAFERYKILNNYLLPKNIETEGDFMLPKVFPYNGNIPKIWVSYNAKVPENAYEYGLHSCIPDYCFNSTWTNPINACIKVSQYAVAIAPDYSLWKEGLPCQNLQQLWKNRVITLFWQNLGIPTIQCASWGGADSESYCFDGLAENSMTAISHLKIGSEKEKVLFKYMVNKLVEKKNVTKLIVFGFPLGFDVNIPTSVFPGHIQYLRTISKYGKW